jgi:hypothetical protein
MLPGGLRNLSWIDRRRHPSKPLNPTLRSSPAPTTRSAASTKRGFLFTIRHSNCLDPSRNSQPPPSSDSFNVRNEVLCFKLCLKARSVPHAASRSRTRDHSLRTVSVEQFAFGTTASAGLTIVGASSCSNTFDEASPLILARPTEIASKAASYPLHNDSFRRLFFGLQTA